MELKDYAARLTDPTERVQTLLALFDAENAPLPVAVIDEIEARYGDGTGIVDVEQCISDEMGKRPGRTEFEALMRAAALLRIRMAFKKIEVKGQASYVRMDKVQ